MAKKLSLPEKVIQTKKINSTAKLVLGELLSNATYLSVEQIPIASLAAGVGIEQHHAQMALRDLAKMGFITIDGGVEFTDCTYVAAQLGLHVGLRKGEVGDGSGSQGELDLDEEGSSEEWPAARGNNRLASGWDGRKIDGEWHYATVTEDPEATIVIYYLNVWRGYVDHENKGEHVVKASPFDSVTEAWEYFDAFAGPTVLTWLNNRLAEDFAPGDEGDLHVDKDTMRAYLDQIDTPDHAIASYLQLERCPFRDNVELVISADGPRWPGLDTATEAATESVVSYIEDLVGKEAEGAVVLVTPETFELYIRSFEMSDADISDYLEAGRARVGVRTIQVHPDGHHYDGPGSVVDAEFSVEKIESGKPFTVTLADGTEVEVVWTAPTGREQPRFVFRGPLADAGEVSETAKKKDVGEDPAGYALRRAQELRDRYVASGGGK